MPSMIPVLYPYQADVVSEVDTAYALGYRAPLLALATGAGKCLGEGTPVLMHDGSIRKVEDVKVGDELMGPDSLPRRVANTVVGEEELFRVIPVKGDTYVVNRSHILSLRMTGVYNPVYCGGRKFAAGEIANVTVSDYLTASGTFKHCAKGWRTGVDFPARGTPSELPPYILGIWLGDGSHRTPSIFGVDPETFDAFQCHAESMGMTTRREAYPGKCPGIHIIPKRKPEGGFATRNIVKDALRKLDLLHNKHVPEIYRVNSREVRLQVLAGLMDTDGFMSHNGYNFVSAIEQLADDVCFLARSLGLAAYKVECRKQCVNNGVWGTYFKVNISGDTDMIPCRVPRRIAAPRKQKKNVLNVGIRLESVGHGKYYGFQIEAPPGAELTLARLFLLGDFTVTHNTVCFSHLTMEEVKLGNRVWILAHRQELLSQASRTLVKFGVPHGVLRGGTKPDLGQQVLVASTQTVVRRLKDLPPPNLIILDESHHGTSKGCLRIFDHYPDARLLGVTATPCRLDGRGLGEVFDYLITGPTNTFLVENGFLPHLKYYAPPVKADIASLKKLGGDYATRESEEAMDKPTVTGDAVSHYRSICEGASMIVFCVSVAHAQHVAERYRAAGYSAASVDGNLSDEDREDRITGLGSGKYQILTSCELIGEGLDVPAVEAVQLLRPTASLGLHLQQIGRIRVSKERPCGFVLDHVGNVGSTVNGRWVQKHGFASTEHRWTLDAKKKMTGDKGPATRTCGACYAVHLFRPACPYCGWEHPVKERTFTAMKVVDGTLVEVEQTKEEQRDEVRAARSIPELMGIAKARGYKRPYFWALKTFQGRPIDTSLLT